MKFHVLACDYDGTIANDGVVSEATLKALEDLLKSGRKLILVTGRELDDLFSVFKHAELFEWIVAENGAVLFNPATRENKILAEPPPSEFVEKLKIRGVGPISVGKAIVATWEPHQNIVLDTVREMGLELHVIFNKGAVMVLPSGTNKATGLRAALDQMGISPHNIIGVGDAENDHAFLKECECGVALANALPGLKSQADYVTQQGRGEGVQELIGILLEGEKVFLNAAESKRSFVIGKKLDGSEEFFSPFQGKILIAGSSGGGKSTFTTTLIEGFIQQGLQFCLIDPEGDYVELEKSTVIGDSKHVPTPDEISTLLENQANNAVINLVGVPLADRPQHFLGILSRLQDLRARFGRPHWIAIDEAHHVLPSTSSLAEQILSRMQSNTIFVTMNPSDVLASATHPISTIVGVGANGPGVLQEWARNIGHAAPKLEGELEHGVVWVWKIDKGEKPFKLKVNPSSFQRRRHKKKYAEGELPKDRSFHFKGPDDKLNLRAYNLINFIQLAEGVDEDTWLFHLKRHDYSAWIGGAGLKDQELGCKISEIESQELSASESLGLIKKLIETSYTLPTKSLATEKEGSGTKLIL